MSATRLWFRIEEVLPIAEHAVSCPTWRLTGAQARAHARLRPALIWETNGDGEDCLTSNGVPVWYDQDGDQHAAAAHAWLHTPTGRRGVPTATDDPQRFFPLSHNPHDPRRPLIIQLRAGVDRGGHWLALDTDPAAADRRDRFQILDHREDIVPADARWTPATVTAAYVAGGEYPALVADRYSVRGADVLARFDRGTVEQMITDLAAVHAVGDPMPGEFAVLRLKRDVLVVSSEFDDGAKARLVELDRVYPDAEGRYAAGAYLWPWEIAG